MAKKAPNLRHFAKKCKRFIYFMICQIKLE